MLAAGTPAPLTAAMTAVVASLFCARAAVAVFARVSTVNDQEALSGTEVTVPEPVTVIVLAGEAVAERPNRGCATPLIAEATSRSSATGMIQRILGFMRRIRRGAPIR